MMNHSTRRSLASHTLMLGLLGAATLTFCISAFAQPTTIAQDMVAATKRYVAEKSEEVIKAQSKQAIIAAYKKIYRSGADKRLVRMLGVVALSAEEIDTFADNMAKATVLGDPEAVKAASAQVAVALGQTLTKGLSDPALRMQMASLLGGAEKVNEIADVVGQAAGGDTRAAMEFAGRAIIAVTPAAAIFTAGETAVGVMKYANEKFTDDSLEDLYRRYTDGDADEREQIRRKLESDRVYSYIIRNRRMELAAEKEEAIRLATAKPSDRLREHLLEARDADVINNILRSFDTRAERERVATIRKAASVRATAEATAMLEALNSTARNRWGKDWSQTRVYDLDRFMQTIRDQMRNDGILDPDNPRHIAAMSRLLSTRLVHGANSEEYRRQLSNFEEYRRTLRGNIAPISAPAKDVGTPASIKQTPAPEPDRGRDEVAAPKKKGVLVCTCEDWNKDGAYGVVLGKEIISANYGPYAKCMAYAATLNVCYK